MSSVKENIQMVNQTESKAKCATCVGAPVAVSEKIAKSTPTIDLDGDITFQFNAIAFSDQTTKLYVCGDAAAIGNWDPEKCPEMKRIAPTSFKPGYPRTPSYFTCNVTIPGSSITCGNKIEFKFIREENGTKHWENGIPTKSGNRSLRFDQNKESAAINDHLHMELSLGPQNIIPESRLIAMSPTQFQVSAEVSEYIQTTSYYCNVKDKNDMDYHTINEHIILGSSPRTREHLKELKELGVHTIVNLQTIEDVLNNGPCHADKNNTISDYRNAIKEAGLDLIWQPTTDMCTEGRATMVATIAWLIGGVLEHHRHEKNNKMYVHCNAGVGRSTAATMAYLCYLRGFTPEQAHWAVSSIRPVVFFDKEAIMRGKAEFDRMYGTAKNSLMVFN